MRTWLCVASLVAVGAALHQQVPSPKDWIDADTGHRVVRLTDDGGGSTLYFHDNAFSPRVRRGGQQEMRSCVSN